MALSHVMPLLLPKYFLFGLANAAGTGTTNRMLIAGERHARIVMAGGRPARQEGHANGRLSRVRVRPQGRRGALGLMPGQEGEGQPFPLGPIPVIDPVDLDAHEATGRLPLVDVGAHVIT
jgi:hypothetical protein